MIKSKCQALFHKSLKLGGVEAGVDRGLLEANVLEHAWDPVLRCYHLLLSGV